MDLNLKGKKAVVCGSSQGLGLAAAKELALLGAEVTLCARNAVSLGMAVEQLKKSDGQQHGFLVADFDYPDQVEKAINNWVEQGNTAHILVNNTGGPAGGPLLQAAPLAFVNAFQSHLICNHILSFALIPGMKEAQYGRIINIISTSVKQPLKDLGVSNTIRAAVANWSKTLANEVGSMGITVNNVLPGLTHTSRASSIIEKKKKDTGKSEDQILEEMLSEIPAGRMGLPEELGATVAFLCSPAAAYINGINLPVDGGRLGCL